MANKKINQLVSKTAILSTDLFGIGDATTGQLFKKTIAELQAAIGGAVISVNGLVGTVVLDTDDIQELATPTNKWFTDARARAAISLTVTGNSGASTYSSGTGVLNVPTYTLAGLGGISASFLSGTSGISYNSTTGVISYSGTVYTDASIRALLSGGTGITYNSTTGAISYSGTVYTDSSVRALISLTTTGTSGASTYNNTTGVINVPNYTLAGLGGISLTSLSGGTGISYNSSTGAISSTITQYTDALARASVSLTTTGTSGASTYNSTTGVLNIPQYASALSGTTNYHAKFTSSSTIGNSLIYDDGTNVGISTTSANEKLVVYGTSSTRPRLIVGQITTSTAIYSTYNTQDTPSIEVNTSSTAGFAGLTLSNSNNTSGNTLGGISYVASGTSASDKRGAIIISSLESASTSSVSANIIFFTNSANTLAERMRIKANGNVAIGTSTDVDHKLKVAGIINSANGASDSVGGGAAYLLDGSATNGSSLTFLQQSVSRFSIWTYTGSAWGERMTITSTGNVGIGITNPFSKLVVSSDNAMGFEVAPRSTGADIFAYNRGNSSYGNLLLDGSYLTFNSAGSARMTILGSGNVAIGTTSDNGYKLYVSGTIYATGNITANSDLTLKKNLKLITNPTDKLMQLNGYSYQWKSDDSHQYGVIAQEVEKILPYAVSTGNDGIKGVSYNQIIPVLIEAVKEQKKELEELRNILASK